MKLYKSYILPVRVLRFNKEPNFQWHGEAAPLKIGSLFSCVALMPLG